LRRTHLVEVAHGERREVRLVAEHFSAATHHPRRRPVARHAVRVAVLRSTLTHTSRESAVHGRRGYESSSHEVRMSASGVCLGGAHQASGGGRTFSSPRCIRHSSSPAAICNKKNGVRQNVLTQVCGGVHPCSTTTPQQWGVESPAVPRTSSAFRTVLISLLFQRE
jgi:hypothetical protein